MVLNTMDLIWALDAIFGYTLIYALTFLCTCVQERKALLKFLH